MSSADDHTHAGAGADSLAGSDRTISDLLSYRVSRLSGSLTRSAAARYRQEFDVSIGEWRVLALLGQDGETTLNRLARRAALDKAQMSRVVRGLEERGFVTKSAGARRSTVLALSDLGNDVCRGLIASANEREAVLRAGISAGSMLVFEEVLDRLYEMAQEFESPS